MGRSRTQRKEQERSRVCVCACTERKERRRIWEDQRGQRERERRSPRGSIRPTGPELGLGNSDLPGSKSGRGLGGFSHLKRDQGHHPLRCPRSSGFKCFEWRRPTNGSASSNLQLGQLDIPLVVCLQPPQRQASQRGGAAEDGWTGAPHWINLPNTIPSCFENPERWRAGSAHLRSDAMIALINSHLGEVESIS